MKKSASDIAKRLILVVAGTALSLAMSEMLLRIHNPVETRLRGDHIALPIRKTYVSTNTTIAGLDQEITHSKNSLGFRGPDPPSNLEMLFSIVAVGGSTTECSLISDGKTWTDVLASQLHGRFNNIWVNNAGLDGHSTFGHTVLVEDILLDIHPNLLLFLIGANDVGLAQTSSHTASQIEGPLRTDSVEGLFKSLAYHSEVVNVGLNGYRMIRARSRGLAHAPVDIRDLEQVYEGQGALEQALALHRQLYLSQFERRVDNLVALCSDNNIEPILITQPALYGDGIDAKTGVDLSTIKVFDNLSGRTAWHILELYNESTRRVARNRGLLLIDLAHELPKDSNYYYDFLHFTNVGSHRVGTIVAAHLAEHLSQIPNGPVGDRD